MNKVVNKSINDSLREFCEKSQDFRRTLHDKNKELPTQNNTKRSQAVFAMLNIASEHGLAIHASVEKCCFISALALLRMQFESVLKASWLYWIAKEKIISELPVNPQDILERDETYPSIKKILSQLKNKRNHIYNRLNDFGRNYEFTCSHIHSGRIALDAKINGLNESTIIAAIKNSNHLEVISNAILAELLNSEDITEHVRNTQLEYSDCLPFSLKK